MGRIIAAVTERLVPEGGELPLAPAETGTYSFLARYLRDQDPGTRFGLKALFIILDLAPILFIGRCARFVNLSPAEQDLYLADWGASRIYYRRMVLVLLKTVTGMGYYNDPQVLERMGFKLPCGTR
jgi:hypothetical protein